MMRFILTVMCLLWLSSCADQQCLEANDYAGISFSGAFEVSARETEPHNLNEIEGISFADLTFTGEIYMNCSYEEREIILCGLGCTPEPTLPGGVSINNERISIEDNDWTNANINLSDSFVIIKEVEGMFSVRSTRGNKECLLSAEAAAAGCQVDGMSGISVDAEDTDSGNPLNSYLVGQGDESIVMLNEDTLGLSDISIKLFHKDTDGNVVAADPSNPAYDYEGTFILKYHVCRPEHTKNDGECIDQDYATNNIVMIQDEVGDNCDGDGIRDNNYGSYDVTYEGVRDKPGLEDVFSTIIVRTKELFFGTNTQPGGIVGTVYTALIQNVNFRGFVMAMATLSVIFMGYGYISGISQIEYKELFSAFLRMSVMFALISEQGFAVFWEHIIIMIIEGVPQVLNVYVSAFNQLMTSFSIPNPDVTASETILSNVSINMTPNVPNGDWSDIFVFFDVLFNMFINEQFWLKILSLFFAMPFDIAGVIMGLAFLALMLLIFVITLIAIAQIVLAIITSFTVLTLAIILLPLILIMWQFKQTRSSFTDVFVPYLYLAFFLPVITVIGGCLVSILLYISVVNMMNFTICKGCVFYFDIFHIFGFCLLSIYVPEGTDITHSIGYRLENFPISFSEFMFFIMSLYFLFKGSSLMIGLSYDISKMRVYSAPTDTIEKNAMSAAYSSMTAMRNVGARTNALRKETFGSGGAKDKVKRNAIKSQK